MFRASTARTFGAVRRPRRLGVAVTSAGLALATLTGVTAASAADTAEARGSNRPAQLASVTGSGRIFYAFAAADEIRFSIDAQAAPYTRRFPDVPALKEGLPTDARGTVRFSHRDAASGNTYHDEAAVDCLVTGDRVATLTAVVTKSEVGNVGQRIGLSVYDGATKDTPGHSNDRLGFSWGVVNLDVDAHGHPVQPVVGTCMAPAPFAPVVQGGFTVHHADLLTHPPTR
ncbi:MULTISPECIES: hypothetical protein [Kitasatospora]|uniref:Repetin n=1 Tax=Kitasatospora cystarginea TaxID=58350 RepID=A0ABN3F0L5_9ACTN